MSHLKSIRARLLISVLLLSLVAIGIGLLAFWDASDLKDRMYLIAGPIAERARLTDEVDINLIDFIRMQKNVLLADSDEKREQFITQQNAIPGKFQAALDSWEAIASDSGKDDITQIRAAWTDYLSLNDQVVSLARQGRGKDAQALSVNKSFEIFARIRKPLDASKKRAADALAKQKEETATVYQRLCWILGLTILLGVGVSFCFGWYVVNETVRRLRRVSEFVHDIAAGEGDLTKRVVIRHDDELGQIGIQLNVFLDGLNKIVGGVVETADNIGASTNLIATSADRIAQSTSMQNSQAAQVSTAMQQMSGSVADVSRNSSQATDSAQQAGAAAQSGVRTVEDTVHIMRDIASSTRDCSSSVQQLDESGAAIGRIVSVIGEIAGQTNLLALNAAIEAARAGEQGRGFAVVAGEVRRLAERTTQATKEISEMISTVQETTQQAVAAMDESTRKVDQGLEVVQQCSEALSRINASSGSVEQMIAQIAAAAAEQAASSSEVTGNMESIANMVRDAASSAQESAEACHSLSDLTLHLQQLVGRFKVDDSHAMAA